jgi:hypothetical protein
MNIKKRKSVEIDKRRKERTEILKAEPSFLGSGIAKEYRNVPKGTISATREVNTDKTPICSGRYILVMIGAVINPITRAIPSPVISFVILRKMAPS